MQHHTYPEEHRQNTQARVARHLIKELDILRSRIKELECECAKTTAGEIERKAVCKALEQRVRRINMELRRKDKDIPVFCGGGLEAL